ncbi:hypothetical protein NEMBOFW57_008612 [Staphylotrichum longicolle]|uniref:Rhamnogalacturonase A/B/Epimerase-like pectate lyase domain-containing protein n=1 Tax=Staphylotrichum longicolle TaxID=669026 RepID=A0AAD4ERQ8_9PEZI|nr:hypothetical protein NEMBOFW57_008612 [Staphylotrichum longicolle]
MKTDITKFTDWCEKAPFWTDMRAQAIIAQKNKARLENPSFNKHEFLAPEELAKLGNPAPPLDLNVLPGDNSTVAARVKRRHPYTLPDEVIEAARIIAESVPQIPTGDQPDAYRPAKLQRPMGGLGRFGDGVEYSSNSTAVESASDGPNDASQVAKRDYGYWMADMPQLGASPYAPAGYKVWRNVKDFGAVGNGVHDDTAAIQLAITQGSRCGASCNSSTIVPAVVYFPPGTYLVSATIIQYYNTQFLGDPHNLPTLLAATSFTGGSVISSNVYTGDNEEWYLNTANFMRSIRNFKIDLRIAPAGTYLAGIHWQVAQASSLENIEFYMRYNSDTPGNTQQGIYMENGSGGFLADLTFVGGNFGAYMGNQQFTTSHLVFVNCNTAVQIHWDWAWTMHDYIIESCANGVVVVGGAGGGPDKPDGQGVGSLILVDSIIANTPNGIITTLLSENSTSFLLQNVGFFNVQNSIRDSASNRVLLAGGNQVTLQSWGFGQVNNVTGTGSSQFVNGANIAAMPRPTALLGSQYDNMPSPNIFTRRRPRYSDVPQSNILNVKALGAKGDGATDDTAALNAILAGACNTSSIVYFPYGVYIVTDTLRVPIGSRIIGQAWSQIMGKGAKFQNEQAPRPVVQVALPGEVGIIEIQDMLFTVQGGTAGAVVVEWNAREQSPGSVGLWDTHIRVGGAKGSNLQYEQCPKLSGQVKAGCKAASLLMHLKPGSTAYMENAWLWVADHDLEKITKDQIDVYAGRGLLIESDRAWLWGTASEHAVLYQYQFSQASNIFMSMIQTESPYFQPTPRAPLPFTTGLFPNDPTFSNCAATDAKCFASWAVRIVDSSAIYMLGAGLYSWFYNYNQACVTTNNCQNKGFEVEQSQDIWIYNLCTKAIVEMISPLGSAPTLAADNVNGFLSSILAWLQGAENLSGPRDFAGFQMYPAEWVQNEFSGPATCKTALQQTIVCDDYVRSFTNEGYRGSLQNKTRMDSVCHADCGKSLASWVNHVSTACQGYNITQADPALPGGRMWAGYNETCLVDPANPSVYCNELNPNSDLEYVYSRCGITNRPTALHPPRYLVPASPYDDCPTDSWYTTPSQTTCDDLATQHTISSASLFLANQNRLPNCAATTVIPAGTKLCLPPSCNRTLTVAGTTVEECHALEANRTLGLAPGDIVRLNPWFGFECRDFNATVPVYGRVICLGAPLGEFDVGGGVAESDTTTPGTADGDDYGYGYGYGYGYADAGETRSDAQMLHEFLQTASNFIGGALYNF